MPAVLTSTTVRSCLQLAPRAPLERSVLSADPCGTNLAYVCSRVRCKTAPQSRRARFAACCEVNMLSQLTYQERVTESLRIMRFAIDKLSSRQRSVNHQCSASLHHA